MKCLVIVTRQSNEFDTFWNANNAANEAEYVHDDSTLLLLKKLRLKDFENYGREIVEKLKDKSITHLGVIFHKLNGDVEAGTLREKLSISFDDKLAFCEWYSSVKTDFWDEGNADANLPYNNLKTAWKDDKGDKEKAFDAVWDYFMVDISIEEPLKKLATSLPLDYVYQNDPALRNAKNDLQKAVQKKLST